MIGSLLFFYDGFSFYQFHNKKARKTNRINIETWTYSQLIHSYTTYPINVALSKVDPVKILYRQKHILDTKTPFLLRLPFNLYYNKSILFPKLTHLQKSFCLGGFHVKCYSNNCLIIFCIFYFKLYRAKAYK